MRLRTKTALGIDIGERRISVALVESNAQGVRVVAAASADLPAGAAGPQEFTPGKVLSRLLAQLGRRSQIRRARAAVALSADSMVTQLLDLPKHVPTNIGEFVRSELQQYVALSGKNVVSDFCGVGSGVHKRLLAVAADVDEIREMVDACSAAGIAVDVVEPSMLAYTRAFLEQRRQARRRWRCADRLLGPRTLTIHLFLRGTLDFIRVRDLPSDANTPQTLCTWLAEELRAVERYYEAQATGAGRNWQTCIVLGDGAAPGGRDPDVARGRGRRNLVDGRRCLRASAWLCFDKDGTGVHGGRGSRSGTAGRGGLRPEDQSAAQERGGGEVAFPASGGNGAGRRHRVSRHLRRHAASGANDRAMDRRIEQTRLAEELYAAPALIAEEKFLEQEIARLRLRVDPLRQALAGRHAADWPGILDAVRQAMPADVSIAQLLYGDGKTLSLKGFTPSCPAAQMFVRNLESRSPFASVSLAPRAETAGRRRPPGVPDRLPPEGAPNATGGKSS